MNICKTCKTIKRNMKIDDIVVSTDHKPLDPQDQWFPIEKIPSPDKPDFTPKKFNRDLTVNLGKSLSGRRIFYYAANERKFDKKLGKNGHREAYGDWKNHGLATVTSKGTVEMSFMCPQNYSTNEGSYISHIHFLRTDSRGKWENKLFTVGLICSVEHDELKFCIQNDCALILNALPINEFIRARIPGSHSLPYTDLLKKNKELEIVAYIMTMTSYHPKLHRAIVNEKISIYDLPIIVYCYNETCNASDRLANMLWQVGFRNIRDYSPGIMGYLALKK